jgi:hypothetical protein
MKPSTFQNFLRLLSLSSALALVVSVQAKDQLAGLHWRPKDEQGSYTCVYGEVEVVTSAPFTYYRGFSWWPSCPAGGSTGFQDIDGRKRTGELVAWDSASDLLSIPEERGDPRVILDRFNNPTVGARVRLNFSWGSSKIYRYFIRKTQGKTEDKTQDVTHASAFIFDDDQNQWIYAGTIGSPNNDKSVKGFGGMMMAMLEDGGKPDRTTPRLALYRLWLGTTIDSLTLVNEANGEGTGVFGAVNGSFFLGGGEEAVVKGLVYGYQEGLKEPTFGSKDRLKIPDRQIAPDVLKSLATFLKQL